ncbi:NifB/NifX family molybdenum-iron cluster-binding protein [Clostridium sp. JS66]|uniref:NifB/NifX family molybdenum-iron cluster-binding protein n=1 Tax=Clostridium sp. JS66 TaxID=3064705 RepID=UPI00298EC24C|nr:NifB/NifX family molybdenum-iron cluster-binding protein [Clostridium sp. JS66]WPC43799.1 NifB/NifX family molybdenum-iron cluster-binding protein [Clostridium sp. JS66]
MNIAVAADGENLSSKVSRKFEKCLYLLIVDMNGLNITVIKNDELFEDSCTKSLADYILKYDCEALITGDIEKTAFDILADAGVTRLFGADYSVEKALELMEKRSFKLIRNYDGTNSCGGNHH